ncbi:MAG: ankyrin repeat domain-containing protein [Bdellovibrionota bacterium]
MIETSVYDPAHKGDVPQVEAWLKEHQEELNHPISDGFTLLHVACMFGQRNLVTFLVGRHALVNQNAANDSKATPLHLAAAFREEVTAAAICERLIENGAELNAKDADGQTALHHAVARGSLLLVATMIEAGADPYLKDAQDRSPMDLAKELPAELATTNDQIREALKRSSHLIGNRH